MISLRLGSTITIPALGWWRQEDQKFKLFYGGVKGRCFSGQSARYRSRI